MTLPPNLLHKVRHSENLHRLSGLYQPSYWHLPPLAQFSHVFLLFSSFSFLFSHPLKDNPSETLYCILSYLPLLAGLLSFTSKHVVISPILKRALPWANLLHRWALPSSSPLCRKTLWNFLYFPFLISLMLSLKSSLVGLLGWLLHWNILVQVIRALDLHRNNGHLNSHSNLDLYTPSSYTFFTGF